MSDMVPSWSAEQKTAFGKAPVKFSHGLSDTGLFTDEALAALLDRAFAAMGLHRVVAVIDVRNTPAAALLRRVGMRQEAHFVDNVFFKGAWGSELLFAILEREWAART